MIFPADNPREARLSCGGEALTLSTSFKSRSQQQEPPKGGTQSAWIKGRAGMEYRDLIPNRLGGKVIASLIRLAEGGEVPDYVHYHKIAFQVIYCMRGRIKVVYEDQGKPFWLERGDLILQPPEIRHRVLECTAGAEVIEISSPAEHETWVDHDLELPNHTTDHERLFGGRRFYRHLCGRNDERDSLEVELARLADSLLARQTEEEIRSIVTTFSQSLCQT
jgi:quercetin dioxygenase-like cupin family protein